MPPLQTPGIASMTPGTGGGGRFTGRNHAAPTNRPGTAGKWQDRRLPQTAHGGALPPPFAFSRVSAYAGHRNFDPTGANAYAPDL